MTNNMLKLKIDPNWCSYFASSLYVDSVSDMIISVFFLMAAIQDKMANKVISDQRWTPNVTCSQTGIFSSSNVHLFLTLHGFNLTLHELIFFTLHGKIPKFFGKKLSLN